MFKEDIFPIKYETNNDNCDFVDGVVILLDDDPFFQNLDSYNTDQFDAEEVEALQSNDTPCNDERIVTELRRSSRISRAPSW